MSARHPPGPLRAMTPDRLSEGGTHGPGPLRGVERIASWCAYVAVMCWPTTIRQAGVRRLFTALLPWAGNWVYRDMRNAP